VSRQQNNRYLGILWVVVAVIVIVVAVQLSGHVSAFAEGGSAAPLVGAGVGLVLAVGVWLHARRRIERAFRQRGPEALLQALRPGGLRLIPNGAAWGAYFEAWVYTLYGRFDAARSALARFPWKQEPPLLQAAATSVEALLDYFDTKDFARGFRLACEARSAADASGNFPGMKTAMSAYSSLVETGRALINEVKPNTIATLRSSAETLPIAGRLIATWGLAVAYARTGDMAQAEEALARCKEMAPYCEPLHSIPEPAQDA
jgi:hypothetical protein